MTMDGSVNFGIIQPRKLTFGSPKIKVYCNDSQIYKELHDCAEEKSNNSLSPPYRRVRALRSLNKVEENYSVIEKELFTIVWALDKLRTTLFGAIYNLKGPSASYLRFELFDSPATPKTIIKKSSGKSFNYFAETSNNCLTDATQSHEISPCAIDIPKSFPLCSKILENSIQSANVNPFTPDSLLARNKKRCRTQFGRENPRAEIQSFFETGISSADLLEESNQPPPKRLALQDTNISRYKKEFLEISLIGVGEFGLVYQCLNRLDGCIYAIKKSIKPVAGSSFEKRALNEVWAHAVLGKHDNVVRYYSAWAEDNHMLIQNEFCNGGSLQSFIQKRHLIEQELKILLLHVAEGLKYIHSNDLVHMDLKAGNIFLTKVNSKSLSLSDNSFEDGLEGIYKELESAECIITYKIGDLGHVTSVKEAHVEEGDCRYLPNEILQEDFLHLFKADIFSLGITLFEAAGGGPLPKNGPDWHKLRNGNVPDIPSLSREFNDLIKLMTHPDPEKRPSSTTIFNHPILCSLQLKSKSQLTQELAIERRKNEILLEKLKETRKLLKSYNNTGNGKFNDLPTSDRCLRSNVQKRRKSYLSRVERIEDRSILPKNTKNLL